MNVLQQAPDKVYDNYYTDAVMHAMSTLKELKFYMRCACKREAMNTPLC